MFKKYIYIYENKYQDSNTIKQLTLTTTTQHYQHTEQTDKKILSELSRFIHEKVS